MISLLINSSLLVSAVMFHATTNEQTPDTPASPVYLFLSQTYVNTPKDNHRNAVVLRRKSVLLFAIHPTILCQQIYYSHPANAANSCHFPLRGSVHRVHTLAKVSNILVLKGVEEGHRSNEVFLHTDYIQQLAVPLPIDRP